MKNINKIHRCQKDHMYFKKQRFTKISICWHIDTGYKEKHIDLSVWKKGDDTYYVNVAKFTSINGIIFIKSEGSYNTNECNTWKKDIQNWLQEEK